MTYIMIYILALKMFRNCIQNDNYIIILIILIKKKDLSYSKFLPLFSVHIKNVLIFCIQDY